jgi:hypothetical protein
MSIVSMPWCGTGSPGSDPDGVPDRNVTSEAIRQCFDGNQLKSFVVVLWYRHKWANPLCSASICPGTGYRALDGGGFGQRVPLRRQLPRYTVRGMMNRAKNERPPRDWVRVKPGEKPAAVPAKPQHDDAKLLTLLQSAKRELQGLRLVHLHLSLLKEKELQRHFGDSPRGSGNFGELRLSPDVQPVQ